MKKFVLPIVLGLSALNVVAIDPNAPEELSKMAYQHLLTLSLDEESSAEHILGVIQEWMHIHPEAFAVQVVPLDNNYSLIIRATMLDMALISVACGKRVLGYVDEDDRMDKECLLDEQYSEYRVECYSEYGSEMLLVELLRKAGVQQNLSDEIIEHLAKLTVKSMLF